ncbi:E3 ubiquitin-protein ligase COP1-like [Condylostylus longicornis]|uniref:E3 ubiquitin-protein ligase COP1-like n=1 Tax=Condylostylus longicornis TaxID=2530218 RepID=UPI00244E3BDB|nr:E3 ubiquitin-protein ligase COP1-like [Condylostylus longicornis]
MHSPNAVSNIDTKNSKLDDTLKIIKYKKFDLSSFRDILSQCCRYSSCKCKATISSVSEEYMPSSIISSIVFDKENSHFAIGGVTKKIKIYDFNLIDFNINAFQYPLIQITLSTKFLLYHGILRIEIFGMLILVFVRDVLMSVQNAVGV